MKISTLNLQSVKQYLRIDTDEDDELLGGIMGAAEGLIVSLTGLSAEAVRDISEMGYAYLCICQQMYDVRDMTVSKDSLNPIVQQIIYAHAVNYL